MSKLEQFYCLTKKKTSQQPHFRLYGRESRLTWFMGKYIKTHCLSV